MKPRTQQNRLPDGKIAIPLHTLHFQCNIGLIIQWLVIELFSTYGFSDQLPLEGYGSKIMALDFKRRIP